MSSPVETNKVPAREFAARFRDAMVPVSNTFSYFTAMPLSEEDIGEYLREPIAALPAALQKELGKIAVVLVPYLEKSNANKSEVVTFDKPGQKKQAWAAQFSVSKGESAIVLAVKDEEVADYHYVFYRGVATLASDLLEKGLLDQYARVLREELKHNVHGEVDQDSWDAKQEMLRRQTGAPRDTKLFRQYVKASFIDTLTLYLHGICCDIDVETGPRQIPSRHLRKRLQALQEMFPPPEGYAVFPEDLNKS